MSWDKTYIDNSRIWGERPSELALFAGNYLKHSDLFKSELSILDVGCGDGRDALYLAENLKSYILGIDTSCQAIELARQSCPKSLEKRLEFLCYDFNSVADRYDVVFASELYQTLQADERYRFKEMVKRCLKPGCLLILSTLSKRDPHYLNKAKDAGEEPGSFKGGKFIHLCSREDLEADFDFLDLNTLFEKEYFEPHSGGEAHHHISWILMGRLKDNRKEN